METKDGEIVKIKETVKIIASKPNLYGRMNTAAVEIHRTVVFDDSVNADDGVI